MHQVRGEVRLSVGDPGVDDLPGGGVRAVLGAPAGENQTVELRYTNFAVGFAF